MDKPDLKTPPLQHLSFPPSLPSALSCRPLPPSIPGPSRALLGGLRPRVLGVGPQGTPLLLILVSGLQQGVYSHRALGVASVGQKDSGGGGARSCIHRASRVFNQISKNCQVFY